MKVTSVNPGGTFQYQGKWCYYYFVNGNKTEVVNPSYDSSNAAKQAMRQEVHLLRRQHGLGDWKVPQHAH